MSAAPCLETVYVLLEDDRGGQVHAIMARIGEAEAFFDLAGAERILASLGACIVEARRDELMRTPDPAFASLHPAGRA